MSFTFTEWGAAKKIPHLKQNNFNTAVQYGQWHIALVMPIKVIGLHQNLVLKSNKRLLGHQYGRLDRPQERENSICILEMGAESRFPLLCHHLLMWARVDIVPSTAIKCTSKLVLMDPLIQPENHLNVRFKCWEFFFFHRWDRDYIYCITEQNLNRQNLTCNCISK